MVFTAEAGLAFDDMEQTKVVSDLTAPDFTVSVPVWLLLLGSYDPEFGTKFGPAVKPDHAMDISSLISVILHDMTVSVSTLTSLLIASTAEGKRTS